MTDPTPNPNQCGGDKLPDGKTCADCHHVRRCVGMFGVAATNTNCDFAPSRFRQAENKP